MQNWTISDLKKSSWPYLFSHKSGVTFIKIHYNLKKTKITWEDQNDGKIFDGKGPRNLEPKFCIDFSQDFNLTEASPFETIPI